MGWYYQIEVIGTIDPSKNFDYFRPSSKLVYKIDDIYNIPRIDIYFEGWYPNKHPFVAER